MPDAIFAARVARGRQLVPPRDVDGCRHETLTAVLLQRIILAQYGAIR